MTDTMQYDTSRYALLCFALLCYAMLCYAMLRHATLCFGLIPDSKDGYSMHTQQITDSGRCADHINHCCAQFCMLTTSAILLMMLKSQSAYTGADMG